MVGIHSEGIRGCFWRQNKNIVMALSLSSTLLFVTYSRTERKEG